MNNFNQPTPFQQPQANPTPTLAPEPPKTFGWLKWVLVVVVVALFSSGTTYFVMNQSQKSQQPPQVIQVTPTPTPDPTANWKTYTNTKYAFSMKYPPNYIVKETIIPSSPYGYVFIASFSSSAIPEKATHVPNIGIYVYPKGNLTLRQLYEENKTGSFNDTIDAKQIIINSKDALSFTKVPPEFGIASAGRYMLIDGGQYAIALTNEAEGSSENPELKLIFDQILSTFRFLE